MSLFQPQFLHCTTTSLYTDCNSNLYAGSPSYLLILFSALPAVAVVGLSIERNQKPVAPKITLVITHHDEQKQVEVKRSSRVNLHEIRLFSGCPYYISSPGTGNCNFIVFFIIPYLPETFSSTMYVNLIMSRTATSLYTDCSHNPYAGLSFYSPCPSRHTLNVLKMIFQSTQKLRSFTYLMSRSIHSSKERSLRCGAICQ